MSRKEDDSNTGSRNNSMEKEAESTAAIPPVLLEERVSNNTMYTNNQEVHCYHHNEQQPQQQPQQQQQNHHYNIVQRSAVRMARYPKTHLCLSLLTALALSVAGMVWGEFSVTADNAGWQSRGTLVSNRQTQLMMVHRHRDDLFVGDPDIDIWQHYMDTIQPGWEEEGDDFRDDDGRRRLRLQVGGPPLLALPHVVSPRETPPVSQQRFFQHVLHRHLETVLTIIATTTNDSTSISTFSFGGDGDGADNKWTNCDTDWYTDGRMWNATRLWPVWKATDTTKASVLDPQLVQDLCTSEEASQQVLQDHDLCFGCAADATNNKCLPPYSLTLFVRLTVPGGMNMDCATLAQTYADAQLQIPTQEALTKCVVALETTDLTSSLQGMPPECPEGFYPSLLDEFFVDTGRITYTSTIYATDDSEQTIQDMYDLVHDFHKGTKHVQGAYDTQWEDFVSILSEGAVNRDMALSAASAFITAVAILVHTRSPFLTLMGLVDIILAFPLAFFTYRIIGGLVFFPFLNFIGVFILFSLGADHIFVSVDKWKNARKDFPHLSTEDIAARALPDAAEAMFLTTSTTAIAFFGTAICPVAPVKLFAIFCGLLIVWDYIMDVLLLFPCLCIYDGFRNEEKQNCCITCHCCAMLEGGKEEINDDSDLEDNAAVMEEENADKQTSEDKEDGSSSGRHRKDTGESTVTTLERNDDHSKADAVVNAAEDRRHHIHRYKDVDEDHKPSLIRRILLTYYHILHKLRWPLLACCAAAFAVCLSYALTLELPTTSDVRILRSDHEFEKAFAWRLHLLNEVMEKEGGSQAQVIWGVTPADTGDHNNPASWSQLVLDDSFDPSSTKAQVYMRDFCDTFFAQDFASKINPDFECPINVFDQWLRSKSQNANETDAVYERSCRGAKELPMEPNSFHSCLTDWAQQENEMYILSRAGIVEVMYFPFASHVRYDSPNEELKKEWRRTEDWFDEIRKAAPQEVSKAYFSSMDYWWYDTNTQMFTTAMGSAAIAISASAAIIALSSRSLIMTLFSVISVGYVLASVTAMMVASGWNLGFLESICFAILIGISVDFVIHFSHAYVALPGIVSKEKRTKHALIYMGPSILAAAVTTMAGALIMLFCVITFFTKFATILFFTITQSLIGSFVVFLTMADSIGPSTPTRLADKLIALCTGSSESDASEEENAETPNEKSLGQQQEQQPTIKRENRTREDGIFDEAKV